MRIIGKVQAGLWIGRASADVDLERTDLPVCRDRPNEEENRDDRSEEQQQATAPASAAFPNQIGTQAGNAHP